MWARSRLKQARALVPEILDGEAEALPGGEGRLAIARAQITSTGMAVIAVARGSQSPSVVVRLPMTVPAAQGLERETGVLASLRSSELLGEWRELIPRVLAQGRRGSRAYRVETALPGSQGGNGAGARLQEAAAEAIHVLHRATATATVADARLAGRWVDAPLRDLWPRGVRPRRLAARVEGLRDELHGALAGQTLHTGWVHGDFWLGNLLCSGYEERVSGIVDWDAAAPGELAVHDVLHLLLYTRRMATGQELGRIVCDRLAGAPWPDHERRLLDRYGDWCHDGSLSNRHALLLYWLRHAALHARQQGHRRGPRHRLWEARNVHRVLAEL